ncbi:TIGR04255 family protein, partial [Anabaena cylindrica UHCC 0172]|uniref:TIGR04255 family protein n=1 Tax=Anabaena cylindrica TaxID=1165 RepID=UPI002B220011
MIRYQYRNPPIEEAVCEFRFAPGLAWNLTVPSLFYEKIRDAYPGEPQQQNLIQAEFQIGQMPANPEFAFRQNMSKLLFQSADTKKLVGVGPDTLSIHSLRPYEGWEHFKQRIDNAFHNYLDVAKPIGVTRIALRYINKIAVVKHEIELSEYFTVYPQLPDGVPTIISGFLTRTESIDISENCQTPTMNTFWKA